MIYPFKIWLTTLISGAILFSVSECWPHTGEILWLVTILSCFNLLLGIPGLVLLSVIFIQLRLCHLSTLLKRWIFIASGFLLFFLTWFCINNVNGRDVIFSAKSGKIYLEYLVCLIASAYFFERKNTWSSEETAGKPS